jgi:predicted N-acetyltransferase YhbS
MDVLPDYGRQGIGTRLVRTFIDWARSRNISALTLITFRHLPWNAPFYEKLGFVAMEPAEAAAELANLLVEEGQAGIDLRKRLCMKLDLTKQDIDE